MDYLQNMFEHDADPRTKNMFLMSTPFPTILISIIYVLLVKKIGPQFMQNRKPFELTKIIILYNAAQVALSTYIFYVLSKYGWMRFNSIFCEPVDTNSRELFDGIWWYFFAKFTEFFDTFFFLLRKKYNQISVLHVFHHGIMPILSWIAMKYSPGGTGTIFGAINSFVHIIMYSYYMFAAMGPQYQKYLWWKRYLTIIQLVQFAIVISHATLLLISDCKINKMFSYALLVIVFAFFVLFSNFYNKTYTKKPQKKVSINNNDYQKPGSSFMSPREQYESNINLKPKRI